MPMPTMASLFVLSRSQISKELAALLQRVDRRGSLLFLGADAHAFTSSVFVAFLRRLFPPEN